MKENFYYLLAGLLNRVFMKRVEAERKKRLKETMWRVKELVVILICAFHLNVSIGQVTFSNLYYDLTGYGVQGYAFVETPDRGFLVAGEGLSTGLIMKLDSSGNQQWSKYILSDLGGFTCLASTQDSCYVVASSGASSGNVYLAFFMKINQQGDTLWTKKVQLMYNTKLMSIQQTNDMGYIILSRCYCSLNILGIAIKLDSSGNLEWSKSITTLTNGYFAEEIKQTPDSGYVLIGRMDYFTTFLLKLSPAGDVMWSFKYNCLNQGLMGRSVEVLNDGLLCVSTGYPNGLYFMKTDFSGNIIWTKKYSAGSGSGLPYDTKLNRSRSKGFILALGFESSYWESSLIRIDSLANYDLFLNIYTNAVEAIETSDNGFAILGNGSLSMPHFGIIKCDSLGNAPNCINLFTNIVTLNDSIVISGFSATTINGGTSVNSSLTILNGNILFNTNACVNNPGVGINENKPAEDIFNVFPNVSEGIFYIESSVEEEAELVVYDLMGKTLWSQTITAGLHLVDLSEMPGGIYILTLRTSKSSGSKKIVLY